MQTESVYSGGKTWMLQQHNKDYYMAEQGVSSSNGCLGATTHDSKHDRSGAVQI